MLNRKFDDEGRAFVGAIGLGADGAAVRSDDVLRDVEPVAGGVSVYSLRILTMTAFSKQTLLVLFGDADAGVFYAEDKRLPYFLERSSDTARRSIVDGVLNNISEYVLRKFFFIAIHRIRSASIVRGK